MLTPRVAFGDLIPGDPLGDAEFLPSIEWQAPVYFFVGRNGSMKSRTGQFLARAANGRLISADRLLGVMKVNVYGWGLSLQEYNGVPLEGGLQLQATETARGQGLATDALYMVREQPQVFLRIAALFKRAFGRRVVLEEHAGFLDPFVEDPSGMKYSLLRDEGHGLRELTVLLAYVYSDGPDFMVFDEPELHLHPSLYRFWLEELGEEFAEQGRTAIVITHAPKMLSNLTFPLLRRVFVFVPGRTPTSLGEAIEDYQVTTVTGSLEENLNLVSDLVFSARSVLVEGPRDAAALETAVRRLLPREVVMQTDFVSCSGSSGVAAWFEIASRLRLDVRAIADLDAILDRSFATAMDRKPEVAERYRDELNVYPATTAEALGPIYQAMRRRDVPPDAKRRAAWIASLPVDDATMAAAARRDKILEIWRASGVWLHPQGTLEDVLGLDTKVPITAVRNAASVTGNIDRVAEYASFKMDPGSELKDLLAVQIERIAQAIQRELRLDPEREFHYSADLPDFDRALVSVNPLGNGRHRLTVVNPPQFAGWFVEFTRETAPPQLTLREPIPAEGA